jgi:hypothetical protein
VCILVMTTSCHPGSPMAIRRRWRHRLGLRLFGSM